MKKLVGFSQLLLILLLLNMLIACGNQDDTPVSSDRVGQIVRASPSPVLGNGQPPPPQPDPTPAVMAATVTPLSPTSGGPNKPPPVTSADGSDPSLEEIDPGLGGSGSGLNASSAGLNSSDLPAAGGVGIQAQPSLPSLKANYGVKGQPKVGIQAGHWQIEALPPELARLRSQTGGAGGGVQEVDVTLDLARRVAKTLQDKGYEVDLLPATVPIGYTADAFVAIHADAALEAGSNGYKLARSRFSAIPVTDDSLLNAISTDYELATGLGHSGSITPNMTGYYAFNNRHGRYAVSKITPAVIIETGYLTNAADRSYLTTHSANVADGIAQGVVDFLNRRPSLDQREKAATTMPAVQIKLDDTMVMDKSDGTGKLLTTVGKDQKLESYGVRGDYYAVWLPTLNRLGFVQRDKVTLTTLPR